MIDLLDSAAARQFRDEATAFCVLIESHAEIPPASLMAEIHARLPRLYASALGLPEVEPDSSDGVDSPLDAAVSAEIAANLTAVLGKWNLYHFQFDPYENGASPVSSMIALDLVEIYEDVKGGLESERLFAEARPRDVLWDWRFAFRSHWARHATTALAALHAVLVANFGDQLPDTFEPIRTGPSADAS